MPKSQYNILLVDDEKSLLKATERFLSGNGFNVFTAMNSEDALHIVNENNIDLAFLDYKMPDTNGLELLGRIKTSTPLTVCFIITAYGSYASAIESIKSGAYDYILKPVDPDDLLKIIEKGIKQRELLLEKERLRIEREETLIQLAREKSRLNAIINLIQDGVLVINRYQELVYYNPAALKILDIRGIEIGDNILEELPTEAKEQVLSYIEKEETRKSFSVQIELKENKYAEIISTPVLFPNKKLAGVVLVIRDITEYKKIELLKNQFISMVAHELKSPMAGVQGFIKLMLDEQIKLSEDQKRDYLSRCNVRLDGLQFLVNDLLDISRMELGIQYRQIEDVNLVEVIRDELLNNEVEIKNKKLEIEFSAGKDEIIVQFDRSELRRVITNLLSNAIKYNKQEGRIGIALQEATNYVYLEVSDTGIGIREKDIGNIFNEFYRAKCKETKGISGTGLGLSIVKKTIEKYFGKIEVESDYGKGSTFKIYLPTKHGVRNGVNSDYR